MVSSSAFEAVFGNIRDQGGRNVTDPYLDPFGHSQFGGDSSGGASTSPPVFAAPPIPPGRQSPNALATLSIAFAFVFAPAGAILGHLGLSQIARTGQPGRRRALIGVVLSYTVIAVAVVAVTVWVTAGSTGRAPARPPTAQAATPRTTPSGPAPTSITAPSPAATVAPGDLAGLLPTAEEMRSLTGDANLTLDQTFTSNVSLWDGTLDRPECWAAFAIGDPHVYDAAAVRGYYLTRYSEPQYSGADGLVAADQSVAAYADDAAAQSALQGMVASWRSCGGSTMSYTANVVVPLTMSVPVDGGNGITTMSVDYDKNKQMQVILHRALAAKANIVVDVTIAGTTSDRTQIAVTVANDILDKIPG
jgi:hypothetical protein